MLWLREGFIVFLRKCPEEGWNWKKIEDTSKRQNLKALGLRIVNIIQEILKKSGILFIPVQFSCSVMPNSFVTKQTAASQALLFITNPQSLLKLIFIESVMPSNHIMLYCPFLLLPSIFLSIRVFSNESTLLMRWPKYWSFSFSIIPSKEMPGLISFRMDWLYLLAVQGTLKSLLQHHSSKASILQCSAFFTV